MNPYSKVLFDLFERTGGDVTVSDIDGTIFTSDDLGAVADAAMSMLDPYVDLVTSTGEAIGIFAPGDPKAVVGDITPSIQVGEGDGMIFMLDGDPITGQKLGQHLAPLNEIVDRYEVDLPFYLPADLDVKTAASALPITLMRGRRRDESQGKWKEIESTFDAFADVLLAHSEGEKDGPCFLQGQSADGQRKSAAQIANYILGVDLDSGAPLADVMTTIQQAGLEAIIYTTHSHLKDTSVIKRDHFLKKMGASDADPDLIRQYLIDYKGMLPQIVAELEIIDDAKHTGEGVVILVQHNPVPKFRAVFPLGEPFIFAKRGGSQQDAILEWKERYAGFCTKLGFFFDEKCVDPARLFYFPRHAVGDSRFNTLRIIGKPLDLDDYDRIKMSRRSRRPAGPANAFTDAAGGAGGDADDDADRYVTKAGFNLRGWAMRYAKKFEVQTMLEDVIGGDFIREPRQSGKSGTHVECPFEAEHTNLGGGGTYVVNASDNFDDGFDGGFTFHCVHNACAGRDRLDFLKELIDEEMISVDDLTAKEYLLELEEDVDPETPPAARPKRDGADAKPAARGKDRTERDRGRVDGRESDRGEVEAPEVDEEQFDDEDSVITYFNRWYAVCRGAGGVRILVEPRHADDDVTFETQNDVALFERNKVMWVGGNKDGTGAKKIEAFKFWVESPRRRTYDSVVFKPGERVDRYTYNLFRGFPIRPVETTWVNILDNKDEPVAGDWSMLRGHIYENICESNPRYFNWLMTWLAMLVQEPDNKPGSTVVITGDKGTGKSTVFDYINQLLGRHGITVSQRKQIVGQFNSHIATALLMVCEEAFWAADPQAEGVLKDLITNKSVLIEKKGRDPIQSSNYTRLALISNSEWVVPATLKDERRFFVLRCATTRRSDLKFFGAIREQMEDKGGLEALMYDLLHWEPVEGTFASLYMPPKTSHLQQQQVESLSGIQKFMLELIRSGIYETHDDRVQAIELNSDKETMVQAVDMRAAVEDYVRLRFASDKAKTSYDDISAVVRDWFGAREVKMQFDGGTNKKRMFIFPPLDEARKTLMEKKGLNIEVMTEEYVKAIPLR
jgi:hypothetical protein